MENFLVLLLGRGSLLLPRHRQEQTLRNTYTITNFKRLPFPFPAISFKTVFISEAAQHCGTREDVGRAKSLNYNRRRRLSLHWMDLGRCYRPCCCGWTICGSKLLSVREGNFLFILWFNLGAFNVHSTCYCDQCFGPVINHSNYYYYVTGTEEPQRSCFGSFQRSLDSDEDALSLVGLTYELKCVSSAEDNGQWITFLIMCHR